MILSTKGKFNAFWVADGNTQQHFCWRNKTWVELCKILSLVYMYIWGLYLLPDYVCLIIQRLKTQKGQKKSPIFQSCLNIEDLKFLRMRFFLLCSLHDNTIQGPLITDGRNSNEMLILWPIVGYPWYFKSDEDYQI